MKLCKKLSHLCMVCLLAILLFSCDNKSEKIVEKLTLITVNDFHGALEETSGNYGIARLATNFQKEVDNAEASVII